jgi:hypothetical protein
MTVMPEGRDTEEPDAGHGNERAAGAPPEDIDARQLKERIDRLDETLARISAMLPLLRGGADRGGDDRDPMS